MSIDPPSFSDHPAFAFAAVSDPIARVFTHMASLLQGIRQPALPLAPLVTTSRGESWYRPASRQAQDALQMLLLTPLDDLHPRLQTALQAIVVEYLQRLPHAAGQVSSVIEAITAALCTGCTLEDAYGSVTAARRDALWLGGPYRDGDPVRDLLLDYLALIQGQVIEMALSRHQYACTHYRQLPEQFDQQQAALAERLGQAETQALASEALVGYRQLNQWLSRHEIFVQWPVDVAQQLVKVLLLPGVALPVLARQLIACCQRQVSVQTLSDDWRAIGSQLKHASTPRELVNGISSALEKGLLTPLALVSGLYALATMPVSVIPASLFLGTLAGAGQHALSGRLREYVGSPSLESTRFLQALNRLAGNCASLKYYAQLPLGALEAWLNPAPAVPLGITQVVYDPQAWADEQRRWARDQRPFQQGGSLPPGASSPPSTSAGNRPSGFLHAVRHLARGVVRAGVGLMWRAPAVIEREVDVEMPLYGQAPQAVYQPTTTPMIGMTRGRLALAGLGAVTVSGATVARYRAATRPDTADFVPTPGETDTAPVFSELTPHGEAVLEALNHFHQKPDGTLTSTLLELRVMLADPALAGDKRARQDRVMALLHKDFGPALAGLRDLVQSGAEADFAEFDAPELGPERLRRDVQAQTVPQVTDEAMAGQIIAWVQRTLVSARWQDREMQLQVFGEWLKRHLPGDHWLQGATPQERALWLEHQQRLAESYQHLGRLECNSLEPFKAQRPALQKAWEDVGLSELQLAVLESKLKGDLRGASYIPGLEVMAAALNGEPLVTIGSLQLATGQGADQLTLTVPQWLVFVRRNPRGEEDGVVLYRPAERWMQAFSTQQQMYQHLDLRRLRQSLQAEVQPPAAPAGLESRLVARPNHSLSPMMPRSLPEVVLGAVPPGQWASWRHFFDEYGRQPHLWTSAHVQVVDADVNLHKSLELRAGKLLDREQARLQARLDDPYLSSQEDMLWQTRHELGKFNDEYLPTLRTVAHRDATAWLTRILHHQGVMAANATVDADALIINFNGLRMSLVDGVLEGYRRTADNVFAGSNNFIQYATIEHHEPAVARVLNQPQGRQGLQEYLRRTYPGTAYIETLEQRLEPEDELGRRWRGLYMAVIKQGLLVALARAKAGGQLDDVSYRVFKALVSGLPARTTHEGASLHALYISRVRVPEVLVLSQEQRADYLYLDGPYGLELLTLADYLQRVTTPVYRDDLQARTLKRDETLVDNALRGAVGKTAHTVLITDFKREVILRWLHDQIDNAREATTTRDEVRWTQALKGLRYGVGALCMMGTAGTAAITCGAATFGLAVYDVNSALHKLERGQVFGAFLDVALLWVDAIDIGIGLSALQNALSWAGKARFSSAQELQTALEVMFRQRSTAFTPEGRINGVLARDDLTLAPQSKLSVPPGKAQAGSFHAVNGKYFVEDTYQGKFRVYEVYSDNGWATIRVRDPERPHGQGPPVHYRDGHWWVAERGLLGGGAGSSLLGSEDHLSLLGREGGSSGFSSEDQWKEYLQLFRLDPDNRSNMDVIRALRSAIENNQPLPQSSYAFLKNKSDGWRAYGLFGQKPFDYGSLKNSFDPASLKQIAADFDFSNAPALHEWLLYDRLGFSGLRKAKWPLWAIKYARGETVLDHYSPEDVLIDMQAFPNADVTRAYLGEFGLLKKEARQRLLNERINGRNVPLDEFPRRALIEARLQALVENGAFTDDGAVRDYLAAFSFPADGDILQMALLSARIKGERTPAWAGTYLQLDAWREYRSAIGLTPEVRSLALQQVLVSEGIHDDLEHAYHYLFKQFATLDKAGSPSWGLCEELVLAKLLEGSRRPVWAIEHVCPGALMNIFRSEDIPADMYRLEVVFSPDSLEQSLVLPEDMRHLQYLKIVSDSAVAAPLEVRLPITMRKLKTLHVQGIKFQQPFSLDNMSALEKLNIISCNDESALHFSRLPALELLEVASNVRLRELKVGRGLHKLQTLDIRSNLQLRELRLEYSQYELHALSIRSNPGLQATKLTFPAAMPELQTLSLEGNALADVSCLSHVRLPELWRLDLSHNRLRSLTSMPRLPKLSKLQLENNAFRDIPGFLSGYEQPPVVDMRGNFMSVRAMDTFESGMKARHPNAMLNIKGIADESTIRSTRPLSEMVAICSVEREGEALRRLWSRFDGEDHATEFSTFLGQLYQSERFDDLVFRQAVPGWLERLATDAKLRRETFMAAGDACASCDDWVSWVYDKMQEIDRRLNLQDGAIDNVPDI